MATSTSDELLNVGKKFTDPLLVTREKPTRLPPPAALSRAKFFLPQLQKANEDLEAIINSGKNDDVDIEKISQDGQFIEMNLTLLNDNSDDDDEDDEKEESAAHANFSPSESDSDISIGEVTEDNIKLPNQGQRKKPVILEMKPEIKDCSAETKIHEGNLKTSPRAKEGLSQPKKLTSRRGKRQRNVKSSKQKRKGQKS
ncbi:uncharacterized protein [Apostichopus japonicus]|uniref:uncharacterized protein n=1 Tax=Stichopus japonicus TaxID=307972 RepID=UPI003AB64F71